MGAFKQTIYSDTTLLMSARPYIRVIGVATLAFLLAACASVQLGRDFDLQVFTNRVQQGQTTRDEVRDWLGDPKGTGVSVDAGGRRYEQWTYLYGSGRLHAMKDARFKILQIKFDQQGLLRSYEFTAD